MPGPDFNRDFDYDFDNDGTPGYGDDDDGLFGHGGFINYNHFENSRFFTHVKPSRNSSDFSFFKLLSIVFVGATSIMALIFFIKVLIS